MTSNRRRALGAAIAAGALAALTVTTPAVAKDKPGKPDKGQGPLQSIQLLSFNDYHGHVEAIDTFGSARTPAGGAEYLSSALTSLRAEAPKGRSLTVAAGDLIGGSTFLSGIFHDEPSVETLNAMGLDVSSVGNHEFDEGTDELLRMQDGGCHPVDGCYFEDDPYGGADFPWLAANVVKKDGTGTLLPGTWVKKIAGMKVGFIGMTLEATPTIVNPAGVSSVEFKDEVKTANAQAAALKKQGVKSIVVLLHEGGYQTGGLSQCVGISDPIATIAKTMTSEVDAIITGHTHQPYVCSIDDPAGNPRLVTSAASFGQVVTETNLVIDRRTGDVDRAATSARNILIEQSLFSPDPKQTEILDKWNVLAGPLKSKVVGTHEEPIEGDGVNGPKCRCQETPIADLVADAILYNTESIGAEIALMNVGGVRASLNAQTYGEDPGEITYAEAFDIAPFGNVYVALDLTGAQLRTVLEQQYQEVDARGSRPMLALGVSEGFTYTWDATRAPGSRVVPGSMKLDGVVIGDTDTVRVGTLNFLADGGDLFTGFAAGTNVVGGSGDLEGLVAYFEANPGLTAPADRVAGL
ncbi:MAG: bifunctional metallophosphatase/5'-nucleotidase [Ornithinibacter sp.]